MSSAVWLKHMRFAGWHATLEQDETSPMVLPMLPPALLVGSAFIPLECMLALGTSALQRWRSFTGQPNLRKCPTSCAGDWSSSWPCPRSARLSMCGAAQCACHYRHLAHDALVWHGLRHPHNRCRYRFSCFNFSRNIFCLNKHMKKIM
eukprot:5050922-Amphidinium_carterae.3